MHVKSAPINSDDKKASISVYADSPNLLSPIGLWFFSLISKNSYFFVFPLVNLNLTKASAKHTFLFAQQIYGVNVHGGSSPEYSDKKVVTMTFASNLPGTTECRWFNTG